MSQNRFETWHLDLQDLLGLAVPPIAIAFRSNDLAQVRRIERTMPPATTDGRTGAVAASCVFWIEARKTYSRRRRRPTAIAASAA